jgi:hypothetical protein
MVKIAALSASACAVTIVIVLLNRGVVVNSDPTVRRQVSTPETTPQLAKVSSRSIISNSKAGNSKVPDYSKRPSGNTAVAVLLKLRGELKRSPKFYLMDDDGRLTSQAADSLHLTEAEAKLIQKHCDDFQVAMRGVVKKNLIRVDELEVGKVVEAYRLKPFAPEGEIAMGAFIDNLSREIGSERAWELVKSVPVEELAGQSGVREVILKVIEPPDNIMNSKTIDASGLAKMYGVQTETRDAVSGKTISTTSGYIRYADRRFFNVLSYE